jgi:hypothetical protein
VGHVACLGQSIKSHEILVGKSECKRTSGKHRCTWEDNIKINLIKIGSLTPECVSVSE